uniref:Uncharacterized protein n=1 Tax=Panagrolaimus sp. PS1159 TaxID=55785 RepID=A0AC35GQ23_9BILA
MKIFNIMFLAIFLINVMSPVTNAKFIDWDKVDPMCTISCGAYWVCVAKSSDCKRPANCVCEKFAGK